MDRINGLNQIIEILRQANEKPSRTGKRSPKNIEKGESIHRPSVEELERRIAERIKNISNDDEQYSEKAAHVFIGSVLAWEFGNDILNDQRLSKLIDEVYSQIFSDTQLKTKFISLIQSFS